MLNVKAVITVNPTIKKYLFPGLLSVIAVAGICQSANGVHSLTQTRDEINVTQKLSTTTASVPVTLAMFNPVAAAPVGQTNAPRLSVDISGIIFSDETELSAAVIKEGPEQVIYHVGETLKGYKDARVVAIGKDNIKIDYHGNIQDINLPAPDYKQRA